MIVTKTILGALNNDAPSTFLGNVVKMEALKYYNKYNAIFYNGLTNSYYLPGWLVLHKHGASGKSF